MTEVYEETVIVGCDAHWKRSIRRNIQSNHLQQLYNGNRNFQTFIRHLWGLCLVPEEDVIK